MALCTMPQPEPAVNEAKDVAGEGFGMGTVGRFWGRGVQRMTRCTRLQGRTPLAGPCRRDGAAQGPPPSL